jgi:inner membrane protein
MKRNNPKRQSVIKWSLVLSTGYLLYGLCIHFYVSEHFKKELEKQNISYTNMKVVPTPFNTILWQGIFKTNQGYFFADYSLLDSNTTPSFHFEENDREFLYQIKEIPELEPFFNFTEGYALARSENGKMYVYGTKFGPINIENGKAAFFYPLIFNEDGTYTLSQKEPDDLAKLFKKLATRIKGN